MSKFNKLTFLICVSYIAFVSIFLLLHGSFFSPDQFFAAALLLTLILGRSKQFISDWSLPITLFLSYDYLRGLVPKLSLDPHVNFMISFDKKIFGQILTIKAQNLLFTGSLHWYDYLSVLLYMSHFIVPMTVGFIFWLTDRRYFKKYSLALLILSYAAFVTFVIFPAMPPWMASELGYIPPIQKIMDQVFSNFIKPIDLPSVYRFVGANLVAAVPSLHAAYPWLTFLFIFKKIKKKALLLTPYVLGVWFAIIYMGEHFMFDIVVGVLYSTLSFLTVMNGQKILSKIKSLRISKFYMKEVSSYEK